MFSDFNIINNLLLRNVVPRQGTETTWYSLHIDKLNIEKCSSPTGDGNYSAPVFLYCFIVLRNVVPRQGTETLILYYPVPYFCEIEKCSSPTGDGNVFVAAFIG